MNVPLTSEEKFWAVLSHLAALAGGIGLLIPAYGWIENRRKSSYAAFQALQALCYQSLGFTVWTVFYLLVLTVMVILTLPELENGARTPSGLAAWLSWHLLASLLLYAIYLFFPLAGAVAGMRGRDYRYPFLGNRLARYLGFDPATPAASLDEHHQDRVAGAMGHFCIIFPLWGLFVPIVFLITQAGRSAFMKFQALQTIVFQLVGTLVTLLLGLLVFVVMALALLPLLFAPTGQTPMESIFGAFLSLFCFGAFLLVVPLFQLLGQWAGLRVLQGRDYRYPGIGRLVERYLAKRGGALVQEVKP